MIYVLGRLLVGMHTPACTHTRTHARTHTRTHERRHARTHTRRHAGTHARTHAHTNARTHAHTHSRSLARMPARTHARPQCPVPGPTRIPYNIIMIPASAPNYPDSFKYAEVNVHLLIYVQAVSIVRPRGPAWSRTSQLVASRPCDNHDAARMTVRFN